jgi:hypothetical protein
MQYNLEHFKMDRAGLSNSVSIAAALLDSR